MIGQGVTAMIVGMLVVFSFLVILVFAMKLMSFVINKWFPEREEPAHPARKSASRETEIAVAVAAARAYKKS